MNFFKFLFFVNLNVPMFYSKKAFIKVNTGMINENNFQDLPQSLIDQMQHCISSTGEFNCRCKQGFYGDQCQFTEPTCNNPTIKSFKNAFHSTGIIYYI